MANIPPDAAQSALQAALLSASGPTAQKAFQEFAKYKHPTPKVLRTVHTPRGTTHFFNQLPPLSYQPVSIEVKHGQTVSVTESHLALMQAHTRALVDIAQQLKHLGFDTGWTSTHTEEGTRKLAELVVNIISPPCSDINV